METFIFHNKFPSVQTRTRETHRPSRPRAPLQGSERLHRSSPPPPPRRVFLVGSSSSTETGQTRQRARAPILPGSACMFSPLPETRAHLEVRARFICPAGLLRGSLGARKRTSARGDVHERAHTNARMRVFPCIDAHKHGGE